MAALDRTGAAVAVADVLTVECVVTAVDAQTGAATFVATVPGVPGTVSFRGWTAQGTKQ